MTYKEMLGKTPESIMPHDFFSKHHSYFMQPADDFSDLTVESFGIHKNGLRFPVEISLSSGRAGSALFYCAIVRDITERKKTEQALRDSEERFRALAESLPEGIIAVDSRGSIVFWNTGAQNLFGYTKEEVLGKPSAMLLPERYRLAEQEGLRALQQKDLSEFQGRLRQGVCKRKDGSEFADEISSGPWPTRQGLYYVAVIRDITERLKAEQALRDSEQRFKELADALPQTVFELDLDGMITFVNRTALDTFGHTPADIDKGHACPAHDRSRAAHDGSGKHRKSSCRRTPRRTGVPGPSQRRHNISLHHTCKPHYWLTAGRRASGACSSI